MLVGVAGEGIELFVKLHFKYRSEKFERIIEGVGVFFLVVLIAGLLWEMSDAAKTDKDVSNAQLMAGKANERASTNELAAKQLEMLLTETKIQLANAETRLNESITNNLPMDIGDQMSFFNALKSLSGIQVELRKIIDVKAERTENDLRVVFSMGDWQVINRADINDIGEEGIVIGYKNGDNSSKNAAHFLLKLLTERNVPTEIIEDPFGFRVRGVPTNAIIVAVCQRPTQLKGNLMVVQAKEMELRDQSNKILSRTKELASNKYAPNSKSLADAQAEYDSLNSQLLKLNHC